MTHASQDDPTDSGKPAFSAVMRERTKLVHREAERSGFIADLIRGRAKRQGYAVFLRNLVPAYAVLEHALDAHRDGPVLGPFAASGLRRLPALERDLAAIAGDDWASTCALLPEAEAYARSIDAAASERGGIRLVAHAYARYLGDLSGGQILKPLLARSLGLDAGSLAFYDFPDIADLDAPKAAMREALDRISADGPDAEPVVSEAIAAFRHNIAVSEAVQAALADRG